MSWFEVDRAGLRQLWGEKDKRFLLYELIANSFDEPGVTFCNVTVEPVEGKRQVTIVVEDDAPEGFVDLKHAYTLFAPTRKREDAQTRGRFNVGEKHVLALAESAWILTTTGSIEFGPGGKVLNPRNKRNRGSIISIDVRLTRGEMRDMIEAARLIAPPQDVEFRLNGEVIAYRRPLKKFSATLSTELADEHGMVRPTKRQTEVRLYQCAPGERSMIFEMGIPVMEIEDKWHVDVQQKIPLTIERDNVRPSFLRDVRAEVLNRMADKLTGKDAAEKWVRDGMSDERIEKAALNTIADKRWGEKRVVVAPGDHFSRERALAEGYHIVSGSEMSGEEWEQARRHEAIPAGGEIWEQATVKFKSIPTTDWTEGMKRVSRLARRVAKLMGFRGFRVKMIDAPEATVAADYSSRSRDTLRFNVGVLGKAWFDGDIEMIMQLIIHELGHHYSSEGHLSEDYYGGLCKIGARLAVSSPRGFK